MKKISLALVLFLVLAAVVPARAAGRQTVMTSEVSLPSLEKTPVIDVTVPQSGRIVINPYGLPTEIDGRTTTEQIASETMTIHNASAVPVIVSASAAGEISPSSNMTFTTVPPTAGTGEKRIFLYAEFQNEDGLWSGSYGGRENQLLIFEGASTAKEVLTLDVGPSVGVFRMFGATSVNTADPWSAEDSVSVTFTFSFSPVSEPSESLILDEESSTPEEAAGQDETPAAGETPEPEEAPAIGKTPAAEDTPGSEEKPAVEEISAPEETPAAGEADPVISESDTQNGGEA